MQISMNRLIAVSATLLVAQLGYGVAQDLTTQPTAHPSKVPLGSTMSVSVVADSGGRAVDLSDVSPNTCRYFVIASLTCPYSAGAAKRWSRLGRREGDSLGFPAGWRAGWVVGEGSSGIGKLFDQDFPVETYHGVEEFDEFKAAGVVGVPYYVVLDRSGAVVESGLGGDLPPFRAFRDDCTLDRRHIVPAPIGGR